MALTELTAISPIDGRYRNKIAELEEYFSEYALIRYRVKVEIEYFIALVNLPLEQLQGIDKSTIESLRNVYKNFTVEDSQRIKEIEKTTNHDVKAVEYFIKEKFDVLKIAQYKEFIHFGLTSQDINNTSVPLSIKDAINESFIPVYESVIDNLKALSREWGDIPMLARTHGQPASPTVLGKEFWVFVERIEKQFQSLLDVKIPAKFGGATGNLNAHYVSYPQINWHEFSNNFVNNILGLHRSKTTTQIEHYDNLAALFDAFRRINTVLIDLCRDIWTYISMEYFKQKIVKGEIGSSAMPHKVNPIDFENAEGNLGIANAIFTHLGEKLPISRLQRDLTDSTVLRNVGVPIGHTMIALHSIKKGLGKLLLNKDKLNEDLENNWSVLAEAIQTILRRENYPNPYEALKDLTRTNNQINKDSLVNFVKNLDVSQQVKEELLKLTPQNYIGKWVTD